IDGNGDGSKTRQENLVEGGQLSFLIAPNASLIQDSQLVFASPATNTLIAGQDFDGIKDIVFTGAGNNEVDVPAGGVLAGNNRIFTGSGADAIYVGDGDRAFGGSGNDTLDATEASGYRLSGGAGNDTFF
ncbi:MAG: hypothetical protein ACKO2Z_06180, partial [Sphaerospermopsis kisseleviana]